MVQSAGILVFRKLGSEPEVLLAHPGGPFWAKKDTWSIPKGECKANEDLLVAAKREFQEETGLEIPAGKLLELGAVKQSSSKTNHVWAVEGNPDTSGFKSNTFVMEWPPKSGQEQEFPESDRVAWFPLSKATQKVYKNQVAFLERLTETLGVDLSGPPEQQSLL